RQIDHEKHEIVEQDLLERLTVELVAVLDEIERRQRQSPYQNEIDERREQRQEKLEQPRLRDGNQAERAVARLERGVTMLPQALQRAEGPAEALLDEAAHRVRRLGPGERRRVVQHL